MKEAIAGSDMKVILLVAACINASRHLMTPMSMFKKLSYETRDDAKVDDDLIAFSNERVLLNSMPRRRAEREMQGFTIPVLSGIANAFPVPLDDFESWKMKVTMSYIKVALLHMRNRDASMIAIPGKGGSYIAKCIRMGWGGKRLEKTFVNVNDLVAKFIASHFHVFGAERKLAALGMPWFSPKGLEIFPLMPHQVAVRGMMTIPSNWDQLNR